ncbi:SitI3 family protein [Kitasatospora cineracea]|uniref:SitI3 family protein n=1 Tax=Kitasatospora cineracea TaxID=88074 RepID=UPI000F4F10E8|nr:SitI3 family protein [Kitasatospora cineracea]
MTIAHQIYMNTAEPVGEVAAMVSRILAAARLCEGFPAVEALMDRSGVPTTHGMTVRVSKPSPAPFDIIEDEFGIPSKILIWLEPDKDEEFADQDEDVVVLVAGILEETSADVVLIHNYETVWLIRRGGELILHERPTLWPDRRLALIKGEYRRESLRL